MIGAALQRLAQRGIRPRLRLLGTWTHPAEEQAFLQSVAGIEDQVDAVGWVPFEQIAESLSSADIALAVLQPIPRYVAALPVKLFEYMACGLPVVISDFPAVRQVVAGSDCGILVDPVNVEVVSQAIEALIAVLAPMAGGELNVRHVDVTVVVHVTRWIVDLSLIHI